ncbi:MAG: ABC transporter permease subunit [Asgard group archaeon]|nr:ABC transporter permease subunit [Asgard group archaeon]
MTLRIKKSFILTFKEMRESFKSKEVMWVIILMPLTFAVVLPLTIPVVNLITPVDAFPDNEFENFPALVPYWDELDSRGKFLVFYTMIFFETFLLLPMILPMVIAADSIVGERERKTIEALIATPLSKGEILLGKLMTTMIPSTLVTWISGIIFMVISDLSLYWELGKLVFPNTMSLVLLFGLSPFFSLITTQTMIIVSTRASGMREAQQIGSLVILPLYSFVLGESALLLLASIYWTLGTSLLLLVCTIILLLINIRVFDREYMIASILS